MIAYYMQLDPSPLTPLWSPWSFCSQEWYSLIFKSPQTETSTWASSPPSDFLLFCSLSFHACDGHRVTVSPCHPCHVMLPSCERSGHLYGQKQFCSRATNLQNFGERPLGTWAVSWGLGHQIWGEGKDIAIWNARRRYYAVSFEVLKLSALHLKLCKTIEGDPKDPHGPTVLGGQGMSTVNLGLRSTSMRLRGQSSRWKTKPNPKYPAMTNPTTMAARTWRTWWVGNKCWPQCLNPFDLGERLHRHEFTCTELAGRMVSDRWIPPADRIPVSAFKGKCTFVKNYQSN